MSLLGQLLILIGADTSGLEEGTKRGKKKLSEFEQYVRNARKEMRFFRQAASATGAAVAAAWISSTVKDYIGSLVELKEQSAKTGKSIEELTHGELLTKQVDDVVELVRAFEMLGEATGQWLLKLSEASGLTAFLKDAMVLNAALLSGKDSARILAEMKAPQLEAQQAKEEKLRAEAQKKDDAATAKAAKEFAEGRAKVFSDVIGEIHKLQHDRDKLTMTPAALQAQDLKKKGALPFEIERAEALRKEIESIKSETERRKEAKKRFEEADKWQQEQEQKAAEFDLEQMHKAEEERKRRLEKSADIIEGRAGIGAAGRGTQAAFSAINSARNTIEQKQLTSLKAIERNTATASAPVETVELV